MAVRPILNFDQPVLREKAKKVSRVDTSIQRLIDDLVETMLAAPGAGLAAPQIGVPLRVCVVKGDDNQIWALVNPEIVKHDGVQVGYEGCLSYPGWVGEVARHETVVVKGRNRRGKEVRIKSSLFTARASRRFWAVRLVPTVVTTRSTPSHHADTPIACGRPSWAVVSHMWLWASRTAITSRFRSSTLRIT